MTERGMSMCKKVPILSESIRIKVRFSEVDSLRIVWHGHYLKYLEDAREAFGHKYGLAYMYMFNEGYLAPMYDIKMKYFQPASIDEELLVNITYRPTRGSKLVFDYEIRRSTDNTLLFKAETTQLFTNHEGVLQISSPNFFEKWKRENDINI